MKTDKDFILAFDTSNYTTSCAVCNLLGEVTANLKLPLPVSMGERGLRQSEALFHHVNRLPELLSNLNIDGRIVAVGYSDRPRDIEGSYMPCFLCGRAAAESAAKAACAPVFSFSHQSGHIMSALYSSGKTELESQNFYAFHVSGGTTEILLVKPDDKQPFKVEKIGGTLDLNAGQVIDRTGVLMGLKFPCGCEMEENALSYTGMIDRFTVSVKDTYCNLSGLESKASALYKETDDKNRACAFVLNAVGKTLYKMTENLFASRGKLPVIYAGGVMSCSIIKEMLSDFGSFASPEFSSDNAAGCALLTRRAFIYLKGDACELR